MTTLSDKGAPSMSLVAKLVTIMGELGNVPKTGYNENQKYKFVRESDVVERLVPLLAKYHVWLHSTVVSHTHEAQYETQSGKTMWLDTVMLQGTWMDGDSDAVIPAATFVGTGSDTGDKAAFKAMTGAEKYLLMKSLLISTGDDPESDEKTDRAMPSSGAGPTIVGRPRSEGQARGGRSAVPTTAQLAELKKQLGAAGYAKAPDILAYIEKAINLSTRHVDATKTGALLNFLQSLTGAQVGQLIRSLIEAQAGEEPQVDATQDTGEYAPTSGGDL